MVIGLANIHRMLNYTHAVTNAKADNITNYTSTFSSRTVNAATDKSPDVWDMRNNNSAQLKSEPKTLRDVNKGQDERPPVFIAAILDESEVGYRIGMDSRLANNDKKPSIQIGDLLAVWPHGEKAEQSSLGIVRWIQSSNSHHIEIGIQVITRKPMAVAVRLNNLPDESGNFVHALLIESMERINKGLTLITPNLNYHEGDELELYTYEESLVIKLEQQKLNTGSFRQYTVLQKFSEEAEPETSTPEQKNQLEDDDFHKVWSELS